MPKRNSRSKPLAETLEHGAASIGHWATTDHLHIDELSAMPGIGFRETLTYIGAALILRLFGLLGTLEVTNVMVIMASLAAGRRVTLDTTFPFSSKSLRRHTLGSTDLRVYVPCWH